MKFQAWSDICSFHERRRYAHKFDESTNPMTFLGKVKLHGTNAGINIGADKEIVAQSRNGLLDGNTDNAGFRAFVDSCKEQLLLQLPDHNAEYTIFGEWAGPGVQKGVALSQISKKIFAVFAIRVGDKLIIEPNQIHEFLGDASSLFYILPYHGEYIIVNWQDPAESLSGLLDGINNAVLEIEKCDPWVKSNFGVEGVGEGLVFYPVSLSSANGRISTEHFSNWAFKAKGQEHKTIKTAKPAQADAEKAESASGFAQLVLTEARLQQGLGAVGGEAVMQKLGDFLAWCVKDVKKETEAELEASGLTWKDVTKPLSDYAKTWFLAQQRK